MLCAKAYISSAVVFLYQTGRDTNLVPSLNHFALRCKLFPNTDMVTFQKFINKYVTSL